MKFGLHVSMIPIILGIIILGFLGSSQSIHAVPQIVQLGITIDESGSIPANTFNNILVPGICSALNSQLPIDGTVEITIMKFGGNGNGVNEGTPTDTTLVYGPTLINNLITKNNMLLACNAMTQTQIPPQQTCMSCAITEITNLLTASSNFNPPVNTAIINLVTDGSPDVPAQALAAAANANLVANIDGLTAIAIAPANLPFLQTLVFPNTPGPIINMPNNIPNPLVQGSVINVNNVQGVQAAFVAKLQSELEKSIIIGGSILPLDTTALLTAGISSNPYSVLAAFALLGVTAFGALYISSKRRDKVSI